MFTQGIPSNNPLPLQNSFPHAQFTQQLRELQNAINKGLLLYMKKSEIFHELRAVDSQLLNIVWNRMEDQNPEFFRAYHLRLLIKDQIILFNQLVSEQVALLHIENRNSTDNVPSSASSPTPFLQLLMNDSSSPSSQSTTPQSILPPVQEVPLANMLQPVAQNNVTPQNSTPLSLPQSSVSSAFPPQPVQQSNFSHQATTLAAVRQLLQNTPPNQLSVDQLVFQLQKLQAGGLNINIPEILASLSVPQQTVGPLPQRVVPVPQMQQPSGSASFQPVPQGTHQTNMYPNIVNTSNGNNGAMNMQQQQQQPPYVVTTSNGPTRVVISGSAPSPAPQPATPQQPSQFPAPLFKRVTETPPQFPATYTPTPMQDTRATSLPSPATVKQSPVPPAINTNANRTPTPNPSNAQPVASAPSPAPRVPTPSQQKTTKSPKGDKNKQDKNNLVRTFHNYDPHHKRPKERGERKASASKRRRKNQAAQDTSSPTTPQLDAVPMNVSYQETIFQHQESNAVQVLPSLGELQSVVEQTGDFDSSLMNMMDVNNFDLEALSESPLHTFFATQDKSDDTPF